MRLPSISSLDSIFNTKHAHASDSTIPQQLTQPSQSYLSPLLENDVATPSMQKLQQDHHQLLIALSQWQTKCEALEKKVQALSHEAMAAKSEKSELQHDNQVLEAQVTELSTSRDELRNRILADGAQWRQIMAMSSQLQIQSAEETKRHNQEREEWNKDRDQLKQQIETLLSVKGQEARPESPEVFAAQDNAGLEGMSREDLVSAMILARRKRQISDQLIQTFSEEFGKLDAVVRAVDAARKRACILQRRSSGAVDTTEAS